MAETTIVEGGTIKSAAKGEVNWSPGSESRLIQLAEGYYSGVNFGLGNSGFVITDEGVAVIDSTVSPAGAEAVLAEIRKLTDLPVKYLIYTHGHFDHVGGAAVFKREGATVIGHRNVRQRFDRYSKLWEHHLAINAVQFRNTGLLTAEPSLVYPDIEYDTEYVFELGGRTFRLIHGKGETDDATVVYIPEDRIVYIGDFIIWTFPNVGNPNKVVRYEREWYEMLDRVLSWQPKAIAPGHGPSLLTPEAIRGALGDTSEVLQILHKETVEYINQGKSVEEAVLGIALPEHLLQSPYIVPVYGTREFVIRGIYHRYTGWYDGNPTHLAPSPKEAVKRTYVELIGDKAKVLDKARELAGAGELQLSLHVADLLIGDAEYAAAAKSFKAQTLLKLAENSANLFYHNFYTVSAAELRENKEE
ncbi:alkyl sulfatase dimerization domain-containing protein [Paenibacillus tepidiphilus]|uniref:alkyl sulfatase dimerization domain-containing protein n=1 Tax=Paenibacillus tepidiphilus TaxID=2608683 RepID=UPI001238DC7F|nr:alkyl sulfatase dimerization domain-containing protein [Paenibacillus tepidiphilus]